MNKYTCLFKCIFNFYTFPITYWLFFLSIYISELIVYFFSCFFIFFVPIIIFYFFCAFLFSHYFSRLEFCGVVSAAEMAQKTGSAWCATRFSAADTEVPTWQNMLNPLDMYWQSVSGIVLVLNCYGEQRTAEMIKPSWSGTFPFGASIVNHT